MTAKQILLNWLAEDDLQKVVKGLFFLADKYKDEQLLNDATFQSGRLKALEKQRINDIIPLDDNHLQAAKGRDALIKIIQSLNNDWSLNGMENVPPTFPESSKMNWKIHTLYIAIAISFLIGITGFLVYSISNFFEQKEPTEQTVKPSSPNQKVSTSGENSPAVITDDGDVEINYGEPKTDKDSINKKQTHQK